MLIDVPCSDLAQELGQSRVTVQGLQNTLQQVLDQREEARQSKQLLELYLQALEKEGSVLSKQQGRAHRLRSATEILVREPNMVTCSKTVRPRLPGVLK